MPVPTARTDLSTTAASNSPAGSEAIGTNADDYIRAAFKFIRENYDDVLLRATAASPTFTGNTTYSAPASGTPLTVNAKALGTTDGDQTQIATFNYASANTDRLSVFGYRRANDSAWGTAETRIQRIVDATSNGFISFGDGGRSTAAGTQGLILGGANTEAVYINADTNVTFAGTATSPDFIETSARSTKENIVEAEAGALERILALPVKEFEFRADESGRKRVGVIADEVSPRYSVNGQGVSLTNLLFDLVKAVQELAAK
jgi:hypothetical protein